MLEFLRSRLKWKKVILVPWLDTNLAIETLRTQQRILVDTLSRIFQLVGIFVCIAHILQTHTRFDSQPQAVIAALYKDLPCPVS